MIGYVTLGTNDPARAGRFYDELLALVATRRPTPPACANSSRARSA